MAQERIGLIGLGSMGRGIGKNLIGHGYSSLDGYGFINAEAAVKAVQKNRH